MKHVVSAIGPEGAIHHIPVGAIDVPCPKSFAYQNTMLIRPEGFREYDARWWYGAGHGDSGRAPQINLYGVHALGLGMATLIRERGIAPDIVVGHDYRHYSLAVKMALISGLLAGGARIHDIGLSLSPMAYFAQYLLGIASVAMVTASHNENGWTGVKMACEGVLTFGPQEMSALKDIVLKGKGRNCGGGSYRFIAGMAEHYCAYLTGRASFSRRLKVVVACGNGTAGAFAPKVLEQLGCEVVHLHNNADYTFPHYNPDPESLIMLRDIGAKVLESGADLGLGFDGDGDRCGVVDHQGQVIFADKIGLLLARDIATRFPQSQFVVDVKSSGLFTTDPVLKAHGAKTDYWKTGHSHIKRRIHDLQAIAGFEKSGHFFFNAPLGLGYDDGLVTAIAICEMLCRNPSHSLAGLYQGLPPSWGTPTMAAACDDSVKYHVVERLRRQLNAMFAQGLGLAGQKIRECVTINGVRVVLEDGSWGLVRASSNKPELVVVVESPVSAAHRLTLFQALDSMLRQHAEVGAYNQSIM